MEAGKNDGYSRRACHGCNVKKVRCLARPDSNLCQRCHRLGIECVIPTMRDRPRRKQISNRVDTLEKNLRQIVASMNPQAQSPTPDSYSAPIQQMSGPQSPGSVLDLGLVGLAKAEEILAEFRTMAHHFPFVIVPQSVSALSLSRGKPMLLHAILATASWREKDLQQLLEREYVKALSHSMLVEGEKSLEMLQSLLVYLFWIHLHLKSAYRWAALAIMLINDLGLNRRPKENEKQRMAVIFNFSETQPPEMSSADYWSCEARRAFVGCYFICSSYMRLNRKPNPFRFTPYVEECATSVFNETKLESDSHLLTYARLTHLAEDASEASGFEDLERTASDERMVFSVKALAARSMQVRAEMPEDLLTSPQINANLHFINVYYREMALHSVKNNRVSLSQSSILFDCLVGCRSYLETFLAHSDVEMQSAGGIAWARLRYIITLATRLTVAFDSPLWNPQLVRETLRIEEYLPLLGHRLRQIVYQMGGNSVNWYTFVLAQIEAAGNQYINSLAKLSIEVPKERPRASVSEPRERTASQSDKFPDFERIDYISMDWVETLPWPNIIT